MWKIYLHIKLPGVTEWKTKISPHNPFEANGYLVISKSHVIHSLHSSSSSWVSMGGGGICMCSESKCVYSVRICLLLVSMCVWYVGKQVWTFQRYCWRFSARRVQEKRAEGCKMMLREQEKPALQQSLSHFPVSLSSDSGIAGMHLCGLAEATKPGKQVHL